MSFTDAELQSIAEKLFLLNTPATSRLSPPVNSDNAGISGSLAARLASISGGALYHDLGIGVVVFDDNRESDKSKFPKIWLHNGADPWRSASTGKLGMLLAAVQLREDVRQVKELKPALNGNEFDELFSIVWKKKSNDPKIKAISGKSNAPRISTIFDLSKPIPDFIGADTLDVDKLYELPDELTWADMPKLTFYERLKLAGTWSDNVAATSCISEIGIAYMKAVQRAYGLYDKTKGMRLLLAGGYNKLAWEDDLRKTPVNESADALKYRPLNNKEYEDVKDYLEGYGNRSTQPASASALTAYMIALIQNKLAGAEGSKTIKDLLADENYGADDAISLGLDENLIQKVYSKVGYLGETTFRCEFTYLKIKDAGVELEYAVIVTGLLGPVMVSGERYDALGRGEELSRDILIVLKA